MKYLEALNISPTPWRPDYVDCAVLDKNDRNVMLNTGLCEEANIKLVSAAPDLYDALRHVYFVFGKESCTLKEASHALNKAAVALRKAGGTDDMGR